MNKITKKIGVGLLCSFLAGCASHPAPRFIDLETITQEQEKKEVRELIAEETGEQVEYELDLFDLGKDYMKEKEHHQIPIYSFKVAQKKLRDKDKMEELLIEDVGEVDFVMNELIKDSKDISYLFFSIGEKGYLNISTNDNLLEEIRQYLQRKQYWGGKVYVRGFPIEWNHFEGIGFDDLYYAVEIEKEWEGAIDLTHRDRTVSKIKKDTLETMYDIGRFLFKYGKKVVGVGI